MAETTGERPVAGAGKPVGGAPGNLESGQLQAWLGDCATWVEAEIERRVPPHDAHPRPLFAAMRHALLAGGKRLRPALVRAVAEELGGTAEAALPAAVSIELIHTYSLVHDDLPCMDDDDLRRGRPTVHVAYDEATAVLVGDALQALAFELLAGAPDPLGREGVRVLAQASGAEGMVGGQVLDLSLEAADGGLLGQGSDRSSVSGDQALPRADHAAISDMHQRKTAALFRAAAELGALASGASDEVRRRARRFGDLVGQAFQAVDDLLDVTGDVSTLGKTPGKDIELARPTLVAALGQAGARRAASELIEEAHAAAEDLGLAPGGHGRDLLAFVLARRA